MFIRQEPVSNYTLVSRRGFEDTECPLPSAQMARAIELMEDYNQLQKYFRKVYIFLNQGAYQAASQVEIPKCLKVEGLKAQSDDEQLSEPAIEVLSNKT